MNRIQRERRRILVETHSKTMNNKQSKSEYSKSLKKHNLKINKNVDIFQHDNNKCFGNDGTDDCDALHRLTQALQYHSVMNQEEFTDFCVNNYKNALNDHIHFMTVHSNQIEKIHNKLIHNNNISGCTLSKCNVFVRHYRNARGTQKIKQTEHKSNDEIYTFYTDLFDRFHLFIYHLFDIGLRISSNEINNSEKKEIKLNEEYIDYIFSKKR
eukprot:151683_1